MISLQNLMILQVIFRNQVNWLGIWEMSSKWIRIKLLICWRKTRDDMIEVEAATSKKNPWRELNCFILFVQFQLSCVSQAIKVFSVSFCLSRCMSTASSHSSLILCLHFSRETFVAVKKEMLEGLVSNWIRFVSWSQPSILVSVSECLRDVSVLLMEHDAHFCLQIIFWSSAVEANQFIPIHSGASISSKVLLRTLVR